MLRLTYSSCHQSRKNIELEYLARVSLLGCSATHNKYCNRLCKPLHASEPFRAHT